ncbi:MAG: hypothetical protein M1812_004983 [Candelaria pacifica]|nr:MAG: hypothetical protein M1812_004983 [Candelaria pacifica]
MATSHSTGASTPEPHEARIIDPEDDDLESSDSSASTIIPQQFNEGDIFELTPHDTEALPPRPEHPSLRAFPDGEVVIIRRDNQVSSDSGSQTLGHGQASINQQGMSIFQLGLLDILGAASGYSLAGTGYSLTSSQLQENSLQPGYNATRLASDNSTSDAHQQAAVNPISVYFFDDIKHEINTDFPNTPFPPSPQHTQEWYYHEKIIARATATHRCSKKTRPEDTMLAQDWKNAVKIFVRQSERTVARYEERNSKENWWQILVDVRERKNEEKRLQDRQRRQATAEDVSDLTENAATTATAIANVAQSEGKQKGKQGEDEGGPSSSSHQTAQGSQSEQSQEIQAPEAQPSKKKAKKSRKKKKAKAPDSEDVAPVEENIEGDSVAKPAVEDPAIKAPKEQIPKAPLNEASQIGLPDSSTSSPGTLTSGTLSEPERLEGPKIQPAIPIKFQFKPQRSSSSSQGDKVHEEQIPADSKLNVLPFEGFKFDFHESQEEKDRTFGNSEVGTTATAVASNIGKDENSGHTKQSPVEQEVHSKKSQKHKKKANTTHSPSKSMTEVELKKISSPDRDQAAAVDRLMSEGSPLSIDEARGRRLSIRQGRSDSIKFLRERTLSRESSQSAANLQSEHEDRLGEVDPGTAQNAPTLNPMADTFVPAVGYDSDGWETVTKSQKRRGSKIHSPVPTGIEKQQPLRRAVDYGKRTRAEDSKASPKIAPNIKSYNAKDTDFPALPQRTLSTSTQKPHKSPLRDPPHLGAPKKDVRESKGNLTPKHPDIYQTTTSTTHTSRDPSVTPYESVTSRATSAGEVTGDSSKHRRGHEVGVPESLLGPDEDHERNMEPESVSPERVSTPVEQSGGVDPEAGISVEGSPALTSKAESFAMGATDSKHDQATIDQVQNGSIQSVFEQDANREVDPEADIELSTPVGAKTEFTTEERGYDQQSFTPLTGESIRGNADSVATSEPTAPSESLEDPSFSESEEIQVPVVFNQPDFDDPRVDPGHPDHIPRDHIHYYQAYERAGHTVHRVSRLQFKCAYGPCSASIEDPVMLNTTPQRPSNNVTICNGCGPYSVTRYCCRDHAKADSPMHYASCGRDSFRMVCDPRSIPSTFQVEIPQIVSKVGWKNIEWSRQRAWYVYSFRQKAGLSFDYTIFNDNGESRRLGQIIRGGVRPILAVSYPKGDPRKDIFNRLFNIALFDNSLSRPTEMLWRLIRENLENAGRWNQFICDEVAIQFWYEFAVDPKDTYQNFTNVNIETEWEGPSGMKAICESLEAKHWILRAWRREHPERTMWRRIAGIGFPGMNPMTVDQAQRHYGPLRGWGWNGWNLGKGEFFSYE